MERAPPKVTDVTFEGWRRDRGEASMSDVHRSVAVNRSGSRFRRAMAFVGPGYLVAVGYMDPGN
ncbi:divalent metal cation transporter, partial [Agrobacterium sp. S2]|nr:divalent metal cation transporter [Agrobacterium sp. S2]